MVRDRPYFPAIVIAALLVAEMGALQAWRVARGAELSYVPSYFFGLDYHDVYQASQALRVGRSPYGVARYALPPVPAVANVPLSLLPFGRAVWVSAAGVLVAVFLAFGLATASFFRGGSDEAGWLVALGVAIVLLSYPFHFLFERCGIDGLVLLLAVLAVRYSGRRQVAAGVFAALAILTQLYALLLLTPLIVERRSKALGVAVALLVVAVVAAPGLWLEFLRRTLYHAAFFDRLDNGSIVCTFVYLGDGVRALGLGLGQRTWRSLAVLAYVGLFMVTTYADYLRHERGDAADRQASALLYLPFMVAMPQQAGHYSLVVLLAVIPAVCHYWGRGGGRARPVLLLITVGIALSQWQAVALSTVAGSTVPHAIPGVGLVLVLVGVTWYKVRWPAARLRGRPAAAAG